MNDELTEKPFKEPEAKMIKDREMLQVRMPVGMRHALRVAAAQEGVSMQELIERALREVVKSK